MKKEKRQKEKLRLEELEKKLMQFSRRTQSKDEEWLGTERHDHVKNVEELVINLLCINCENRGFCRNMAIDLQGSYCFQAATRKTWNTEEEALEHASN